MLKNMSYYPILGQVAPPRCNPGNPDISNACIGCICEASTRCNTTHGCTDGDDLCGPFLLSKAFWVDAGSCTRGRDRENDPQGKRLIHPPLSPKYPGGDSDPLDQPIDQLWWSLPAVTVGWPHESIFNTPSKTGRF